MEPEFQVVPATVEHIQSMAGRIRQADIDEFWAAAHVEPVESCSRALATSTVAWAGIYRGEVICVVGVCPVSLASGLGVPWMLGSTSLDKCAGRFLRRCRGALISLMETSSHLVNFVDARNTKAIQWLGWLGFTIHPPVAYGIEGLPFHPFERVSHV